MELFVFNFNSNKCVFLMFLNLRGHENIIFELGRLSEIKVGKPCDIGFSGVIE